MAKKQTRGSVSLNKAAFDAAKIEAERRKMTLAGLIEFALGEIGVEIGEHPQQTPALVRESRERRTKSMAARLPSRERQLLGDGVANAAGFS